MPRSIQLFYKSVFGGEFAMIIRLKDISSPEYPVAENDANKIMHIALPIGKNILMANDVPESMGQVMKMKTGLRYLLVQKVVKKQTNYLADFQQAEVLKCLLRQSLGFIFWMFRDKFGIEWMVDFDQNITESYKRRTPNSGWQKSG
jgi:PhnB protein